MKTALALALLPFSATVAFAGAIDVSATYLERIALPPDAVLETKLLDVSRMDVMATVLAEDSRPIASVPAQVVLEYNDADIREGLSYVVSGAIYQGESLLFRTTSAYPVLTRGAGTEVEIIMERMSAPITQASYQGIAGIAWAVVEINGTAIDANDPPMLTLDQDNNFGLYGGCNRFAGTVEIGEDGRFALPENFAGTLMACPPDREDLERMTLTAFRTITAYERSESGLALLDEAGSVVMRLEERPE